MKTIRSIIACCVTVLYMLAADSSAQEPTFMEAATHPGANQLYKRLLISHAKYEEDETVFKDNSALLKISYGLHPNLAVLADAGLSRISSDESSESGLSMASFRLKYRLLRMDLGPLNTWRTSLLGGVGIPGNIDLIQPDDPYPRCSIVSTAILGRNGLNAGMEWMGYRDEPDRYSINLSHLYRLSPAEYAADTSGAWYTMLELLNDFSSDSDSRFDTAVGILYEARRWALEISLRVPLAEDGPRKSDYTLTAGFRFLP